MDAQCLFREQQPQPRDAEVALNLSNVACSWISELICHVPLNLVLILGLSFEKYDNNLTTM